MIIKDDEEFCKKKANVRYACMQALEILTHLNSSMDIQLPCLALLLFLRENNPLETIKTLHELFEQGRLATLLKIAKANAPDFENDIR